MRVYGIVDENGKIIEASFQLSVFSFLIFKTKKEAKAFRDIKTKCIWRDVYRDCDIKKFNLISTDKEKTNE